MNDWRGSVIVCDCGLQDPADCGKDIDCAYSRGREIDVVEAPTPDPSVQTGLSIVIATSGRPTLQRAINSIVPQLQPGDELLIDRNNDAPWGHKARNRLMYRARTGNALLFMDDDDIYLSGALEAVRRSFAEDPLAVHIFRMHYYQEGNLLWRTPTLECGNVSTQMVCVGTDLVQPCIKIVHFGDRYEGDWDFISSAAEHFGNVKWHEDVIAHYCPTGRT